MPRNKSHNTKDKRKFTQEVQEDIFQMQEREREVEANKKTIILKSIKFLPGIKMKNDKQKELIKKIHENEIIFIAGPAGTGKTFIALKAAIEVLINEKNDEVNQILITKPIVEAGESIGFLPGKVDEKIDPYMHSFESNFKKLIGGTVTKALFENDIVKSVPLAYMRGATFHKSIAILDEAQNTTVTGLKLFLSRKGEGSKLIVIGDIDQTDLKLRSGENNALQDAFARFQGINKLAFMEFTEDDIVRSSILIELMKRYKNK
jgi:phosphate starvation-inducible PhoH-like protein